MKCRPRHPSHLKYLRYFALQCIAVRQLCAGVLMQPNTYAASSLTSAANLDPAMHCLSFPRRYTADSSNIAVGKASGRSSSRNKEAARSLGSHPINSRGVNKRKMGGRSGTRCEWICWIDTGCFGAGTNIHTDLISCDRHSGNLFYLFLG